MPALFRTRRSVPAGAPYLVWLGQILLSVLKLLILPLILVSIFATLTGGKDLWRIGGRALLYYLLTTTVAATLGTLIGLTFSQGVPVGLLDLPPVETTGDGFGLERLIGNLIPSNLFASLAAGNILHIVFVAVIAALASRRIAADHRATLLGGARALDELLMKLLRGVIKLAPIGVAALLAGADLSPLQALFIVPLTMASSSGTAGIPSGGIAMMAFMLDLLGLPQTYLALYLVVDRFFDNPITALNVWGDLVVAAVVDRELRDEPMARSGEPTAPV